MGKLQLKVLTPGGVVVDESTDEVRVPGIEGEFGVLPEHSGLVSSLDVGTLTFNTNGQTKIMALHSGIAHVEDDIITIYAENAEFANTIDRPRAEAAKGRAEEKIKQLESDLLVATEEYTTYRGALQRALTRLKVTEK